MLLTYTEWLKNFKKEHLSPYFVLTLLSIILVEYAFLGTLRTLCQTLYSSSPIILFKSYYFSPSLEILFGLLISLFILQHYGLTYKNKLFYSFIQKSQNNLQKIILDKNHLKQSHNSIFNEINQSIFLELEREGIWFRWALFIVFFIALISYQKEWFLLLFFLFLIVVIGIHQFLFKHIKSKQNQNIHLQEEIENNQNLWQKALQKQSHPWLKKQWKNLATEQLSTLWNSHWNTQAHLQKTQIQLESINILFVIFILSISIYLNNAYHIWSGPDLFIFMLTILYLYPSSKLWSHTQKAKQQAELIWENAFLKEPTPFTFNITNTISSPPLQISLTHNQLNFNSIQILKDKPTILLGANGSGKSTFLNLLTQNLIQNSPHSLPIQNITRPDLCFYLEQNHPLFPWTFQDFENLKVFIDKNLNFYNSLNIHHLNLNKRNQDSHILNKNQIWWPQKLSGGEVQKINLLYIVLQQSQLEAIILDEPLGAVPLSERAPIYASLREWAIQNNILLLLALHETYPDYNLIKLT